MVWWGVLLIAIGAFALGAVGAFFLTRYLIKKHLDENPPVTRDQIKMMYMSMGRKPSEAQINQTMNAFKQGAKKPKKEKKDKKN